VQPVGKIAFQSPCSLQHGQKLNGVVEKILRDLGFALTPVPEAHLCCGSAGTYSLLQGALSQRLLARKLAALCSGQPQLIVTANIGCLAHLQTRADIPVRHWIELLAESVSG
jgi:glycolate oxidase iron-sulfur subunit